MSSNIEATVIDSHLSPTGPNEGIKRRGLSTSQKWGAAIMIGLIFFILASPIMHGLISAICNVKYTSTIYWIVMTIVFIIIVRLLMFSEASNK